ncbi:hypothetical protein [Exiguobacterium sp. s181]|uniref:hypothetical protein n=1 Tax=Exiguobacterium sp. s181 TaxID=2751288 RepID=UPI0020353C14|nr:hypothetical protein [Exiguobacterium sp. s181]
MRKRRRLLSRHDIRHIYWLAKNAAKQLLLGNVGEAKEAIYFIRVHLKYDSEIKKDVFGMRVYRMNECDCVCAKSEEEAKDFYMDAVGFTSEEVESDFLGEVSLQEGVYDLNDEGGLDWITFEELVTRNRIANPYIISSTDY